MTTHTPAPAQQALLTDDEIRVEIHDAIGFAFAPNELQMVNGADLMNVAYALLSKLRAPVADSGAWRSVPVEPTPEMLKAWHDTYSKAVIKTGRSARAYAALLGASPSASAPVADERDAARYRVLREHTAPMRLAESMGIPRKQVKRSGDVATVVDEMRDAALASAPVSVPDECTNKLVSAHYRRGWNACRAEMLSSASAPVAGEAPTDDDILVLALDHGAISGGQHFGPAIRFARALLSQYAAPQASEAVRDAGIAVSAQQLVAAAKAMTKLYPHVWDRTDGSLVVFPENVAKFDAAFDALRVALGEAVEDDDSAALSAQPGAQKGGSQ